MAAAAGRRAPRARGLPSTPLSDGASPAPAASATSMGAGGWPVRVVGDAGGVGAGARAAADALMEAAERAFAEEGEEGEEEGEEGRAREREGEAHLCPRGEADLFSAAPAKRPRTQ